MEIWLVRHGEASSSWDNATDPGLSELGREQASKAAQIISSEFDPCRIVSSPLKRAQETAAPLAGSWARNITINPSVAEIPSDGIPFEQRRAWLNSLMDSSWDQQPENLHVWRNGILDVLKSVTDNTVIFTHYMVLNVVVGMLQGTKNIVSFRPDNCAITKIKVENGSLELLEIGQEAHTIVR